MLRFGLLFYFLTIFCSSIKAQIRTSFSCDGRVSGYYADVTTGCQVYHMCDGLGRKFSFACPNATLFQQRMLICDHWFMVNCSKSESEYSANLLIGQRGKPFVDDSGQSSFLRTPRPDYAKGDIEKNTAIYQNKIDISDEINIVSINNNKQSSQSRWSTEYNKFVPTSNPNDVSSKQQKYPSIHVNFESRFKATTPVYPTFVDENVKNNNLNLAPPKLPKVQQQMNNQQNKDNHNIQVNYKSNYKATTPVYPNYVEENLKLNNLELTPPKFDLNQGNNSQNTQKIEVNFESNYNATTPVYPKFVEDALRINNLELIPLPNLKDDIKVNFVSNFQATTPNYPLTVDASSLLPEDVGLLPPEETKSQKLQINFESNYPATIPNYPQSIESTSPIPEDIGLLPPNKNDPTGRFLHFNLDDTEEIKEPASEYEPPFYPDEIDPNGALNNFNHYQRQQIKTEVGNNNWNDLKVKYSIPDYEFPLDSNVRRANYNDNLNSFQPKASGLQKR